MRPATLGLFAVLTLSLSIFASGQARGETDWSRHDWDDVYRTGDDLHDGVLVPDRLIVYFRPDAVPTIRTHAKDRTPTTDMPALDQLTERFAVRSFDRLFFETPGRQRLPANEERERVFTVDFDGQNHALRAVAEAYAALPGVVRVEPVAIHFLDANLPNDPALGQQWWLRNTTVGEFDIRALPAWYFETGDPSVIVCVADSGTDWQHPELGGTGPDYADGVIWTNADELNGNPNVDDDGNGKIDDFRGWDFVNVSGGEQNPPQDMAPPDNDPMDYESHGTWVAGCVAALSNNGVGIASTNWNAKLMICRIGWLPAGSDIGVVRTDFAAQAMDYARINGAHIFNASWGSSNSGGLGLATNLAINAGMIIVTSAGNSNNQDASYLASRGDVISVAATNRNDVKTSFSSYGTWVDISAPGAAIYTTAFDRAASGASAHTYGAPSGTSFSSPIVAGAFAFLKASQPGLTRGQLIATLLAAVDNIDARNTGYIGKLGSGRLNLAKLFDIPKWTVPEILPTMLDATNVAEDGDEVAVQGGVTLDERYVLQAKSVTINGGYDPSYSSRDPIGNKTILEPSGGLGPVVQALAGIGPESVLDGFEIRGGQANQVSFEPVDGYYGGSVLVRNAAPTLRNIKIVGGVAGQSNQYGGGGGIAILGGSPVFEGLEITGCSALRGAAIYVHQGTPVFRDVNIYGNTSYPGSVSLSAAGGAIYVVNAGAAAKAAKRAGLVTIDGGTISGHTVAGPGGGIAAESSDLVLMGVEILDNSSSGEGGGVYVLDGSYSGTDNRFEGNQILAGNIVAGGGLHVENGTVGINSSSYLSNASGFGGGGISLDNCTVDISGSVIARNTATLFGSGIYLNGCPTSALQGNTVAFNTGASAGANGIYLSGGSHDLTANVVAFNGGGGTSLADGIACQGATSTFSCNVTFSNDSGSYGGCADPVGTNGNVEADPRFCDAANNDFTIAEDSPAAAGQSGGCGLIGAAPTSCPPTAVEDGSPASVRVFELAQNHPNPFNPSTTIAFALPRDGRVGLRIYDVRGRLVRVIFDEAMPIGRYEVQWNGQDDGGRSVASGTYFYELQLGDERLVRKMGVIK